jgi:hypothetical protein
MSHKASMWWTFAITSVALFMVTLDNLVVTTALPVIRTDLHSGLSGLDQARVSQWFAHGMLLNVVASMDLLNCEEPWAARLVNGCLEAN